ncbi:aldehyde dehydrogenase (NADP(+)) [Rhodocytophaga aerolata]|uniref:Aldehyde dehydrogenase (NADP(+)) n=1 Tax=Rhodocytophaga aerolata TaxID=455078 RepID=A0ABT8R9Y3_9BACT|nr:aldehyde dehydrogenase (NADP(+)) [Rhodocytophaga aerolata]MDO1448907.1 aldehyde dehydrogenase (NADP(+)) [Rhodocytophaga aerolata]
MTLTGQHIIGNSFSNQGTQTFTGINPATNNKLETTFYEATQAEVDQAVQLAAKAFFAYRKTSPEQKATFLERIAEEIMALGDLLIKQCMAETALPEARLTGERGRTTTQLKLFATVLREGSWLDARIDTALPDRQPLPRPDIRQIHIPLGVVGIFGASNFPFAFSVAGGDTASALAAGCTVVVKGHPAHPGTSEMVGRAIQKAAQDTGMPEGVFSMLHGTSHEVGMAMVNHPLVKAIGFTGSYRGGKALFDAAAKREEPIPVYAEMGSTNPVFVLPQALKERSATIADGLSKSVTLGVGQFCTNPGLVVTLQSEATKAFITKTGEYLRATAPATMLTPVMSQSFNKGIAHLKSVAGVEVVAEVEGKPASNAAGAVLLQSTGKALQQNPQLAEEVFGPSTVYITCDTKEEILETARNLKGHLTATLHATPQDLEEYKELIDILENKVGRLLINGYPTGVEVGYAMVHGGPYPATTDSRSTSVGTAAIKRFARPVCYQDFPAVLLPDALKNENPLNIWRLVNGAWSKESIA